MSLPLPAVSLKVMSSTINNTHTHTRTEKRLFNLHSFVITQRDCSWPHTPLILNHPPTLLRVCNGLLIKNELVILGAILFSCFNHIVP